MTREFYDSGLFSTTKLSRRRLIATTAAMAVQLPAWRIAALIGPTAAIEAAVLSVFGDRHAARQMGYAVLAAPPGLGGRAHIAAAILEDLALRQNGAAQPDVGEIRARLSRRIRTDFATGRTKMVYGWLLSVTETNLYALAALIES